MSYYGRTSLTTVRHLHPYTQRYIGAMTVAPTLRIARTIDNFVQGLITDGLWSKFDVLYIFKMHDAQAARLNLIDRTFDLSLSGSPTFTAGTGYAGGASAFLQTTPNMNTFSQFTQNVAAMGCYAENAVSVNTGAIGNASNQNEIRPHSPGLGLLSVINGSYVLGESVRSTSDSIGHTVVARPDSNTYRHIKNGVQQGADNTEASVAISAATFKVCGGINGTNTTQLSFVHAGTNLTVAECLSLYNRILTYRTDY